MLELKQNLKTPQSTIQQETKSIIKIKSRILQTNLRRILIIS